MRNLSDLTGHLLSVQIRYTFPHSDARHLVFRYVSTGQVLLDPDALLFCPCPWPRVAYCFMGSNLLESDDICLPLDALAALYRPSFAMS